MIINPYRDRTAIAPIAGTRKLSQDFGLIGTIIRDPYNSRRLWTIDGLYAPVTDRALGGIRAKLTDEKDFFTFINQQDLEVLLQVARPGETCKWSGKKYSGPGDYNFYGFCVDDDDLVDDLYDRELMLRGMSPTGILNNNCEIFRRIHLEDKIDVQEYQILLWDADMNTGMFPDPRMETVENRWTRVERIKTPWEDV